MFRGLNPIIIFLPIFLFNVDHHCQEYSYCTKYEPDDCFMNNNRYLFYDINFSEGFNLRRDVYVRFSVLAHKLKNTKNAKLNKFQLVLPPWSHLVHWKFRNTPEHIPWGLYFDLEAMRKFAPVMELYEFFNEYPHKNSKVIINEVYTLQHFEDMFETGNFEDRLELSECHRKEQHTFYFYNNITYDSDQCLSFHGPVTKLKDILMKSNAQSILFEHAEVALHDRYGDKVYWEARRSMRFNRELINIAAEFRKHYLNSTDEMDNTILPHDWLNKVNNRNAKGGPYLGVHLRRKDFVKHRPNEAPSIAGIAKQINKALSKLNLDTVFVATDGSLQELKQLTSFLPDYKVLKYDPPEEVENKFKDGGVAIIDQIICSHARYFIGTHESTFSFRIQEEREILGFPTENTFNAFCSDDKKCPRPSVWNIVY